MRVLSTQGLYRFTPHIFLAISVVFLVCSSAFIGVKQGNIEPYIGRAEQTDIFTYNSMLLADYSVGNLAVSGVHSFLIKWPLFVVQNHFGLNHELFVLSSILCILAMNMGTAAIVYVFSKRNLFITGILCIGLGFSTLLVDPAYPYASLSWLTMRNIEIPLLMLFYFLAAKSKEVSSRYSAGVIILGTLLLISDKLLLYYSVIGLMIYLLFMIKRAGFPGLIAERSLIFVIALSVFFSYALEFVLNKTGVVLFSYSYRPPSTLVSSVHSLHEQILDAISSTMTVFGADLFKLSLGSAVFLIPTIAMLLVCLYAVIRTATTVHKKRITYDGYDRTVILFVSFLLASFLMYSFIERESSVHARFLVFTLPFASVIAAYYYRNFKMGKNSLIYAGILTTVCCFGFAALQLSNRQYAEYSKTFGFDRAAYQQAADILRTHRVDVLAGNAYVHNLQYVYWSLYGVEASPVANVIKECDDYASGFRSNNLYHPSHKEEKSAFYGRAMGVCTEERLYEIYGEPERVLSVPRSNGNADNIYIYDYDIRTRYRMNKE